MRKHNYLWLVVKANWLPILFLIIWAAVCLTPIYIIMHFIIKYW